MGLQLPELGPIPCLHVETKPQESHWPVQGHWAPSRVRTRGPSLHPPPPFPPNGHTSTCLNGEDFAHGFVYLFGEVLTFIASAFICQNRSHAHCDKCLQAVHRVLFSSPQPTATESLDLKKERQLPTTVCVLLGHLLTFPGIFFSL